MNSGLFFLLLGPSGVGKGTVLSALKKQWGKDDRFHFPITATTRAPREGEEDGKDYFFLSREDFYKKKESGYFLEYAVVHGKEYYGLPKSQVIEPLKSGMHVIRELDIQGLWNIQKTISKELLRSLFLLPPSLEILERRIRGRAPLPEEEIVRRMASAKYEIEHSKECDFSLVSEEGKVSECVIQLKNILLREILLQEKKQPFTVPSSLSDVCIGETNFFGLEKIHTGKVRDTYIHNGHRVLVTTDRQSAFDRVLALVPYKGQVLNRLAYFWFQKTQHIIPNHALSLPDPNILISKNVKVFPVEFVVRAYITGSTDTSVWMNYKNGMRNFCGHVLPEGMSKNTPLPKVIVTPTTKPEHGHDENISRSEIIERGLMTVEDFDFVEQKALELFTFGQEWCDSKGLILVDTKYEFGKDVEGNIVLADEIHTPDSSRFWEKESYKQRIQTGKDPKSFDKDVIRNWFLSHSDPYNDTILPQAPESVLQELSKVYQKAYETITGEIFFPESSQTPQKRMEQNILADSLMQ